MKIHDLARLFELRIRTLGFDLKRVNVDFTGFDFNNLSALDLKIWHSSTYSDAELQNFMSLYYEASSVTHLTVRDYHNPNSSSVVICTNVLSYFPILKLTRG